jgi:hypothetical protein
VLDAGLKFRNLLFNKMETSIFQSRYEPKMLGSWRLLLAGLIWLKMEV